MTIAHTQLIRPARLHPGDRVAVVSPSWAGPAIYPHVYEAGLHTLRSVLQVEVAEMPYARAIAPTPAERVADLHQAFADPTIKAVFTSVGGEDSLRLLPLLDLALITANPKILMGYSDITTLLVFAHGGGLVTFHGPQVMAGFAQWPSLPHAYRQRIVDFLRHPSPTYDYHAFGAFTDGYPEWAFPENATRIKHLQADGGWRWLQGRGVRQGRLFGGCIEVMAFIQGTRYWPDDGFWQDRILFVETSEEMPTIQAVKRMLRTMGVAGVFERLSALLVGRPFGYDEAMKRAFDEMVVGVVAGEFGCRDLPIVANVDIGHTDPQWIVPIGCLAEVDVEARRIRLIEPALD
jgi:muramoyltetrapeptide carboxypeptidase LdcA involved in peptidoglycan recycling